MENGELYDFRGDCGMVINRCRAGSWLSNTFSFSTTLSRLLAIVVFSTYIPFCEDPIRVLIDQ
jgi:hypothetical protein